MCSAHYSQYRILAKYKLFSSEHFRGLTSATKKHHFTAEGGITQTSRDLKKRLLMACVQKWHCEACNQIMQETDGRMNTATVEHIIPQSSGGKNADNVTATCYRCNQIRGDMPWHKFVEYAEKFGEDSRPIKHVDRSYYRNLRQLFC